MSWERPTREVKYYSITGWGLGRGARIAAKSDEEAISKATSKTDRIMKETREVIYTKE